MRCELFEDCGNEAVALITSHDTENLSFAPPLERVPVCQDGVDELIDDLKDDGVLEDLLTIEKL